MAKEQIHRVFFHELGHFVAKELNARLYHAPPPNAIRIFPCEADRFEYCGEIDVNVSEIPPDENLPKKRLAQYLAATTYGCIFQAYFQQISLREAQDKNGCDDVKDWASSIAKHGVDNRRIIALEETHLRELVANASLDTFFQLDPDDFLNAAEGNNYSVDIDRLQQALKGPIERYSATYDQFVQVLNAAIYEE